MALEDLRLDNLEINMCSDEPTVQNIITAISQILKEDEAFHLLDINDIVSKLKDFRVILPRVFPYYAVKCNDNPMVLKILAALGVGFDCASRSEIKRILALGVSAERIIFAHTIKSDSFIQYAASVNVSTMTFDNEMELFKIKKIYPTAKLIIRISCDDPSAVYKFGHKYGCVLENEAVQLLKTAYKLQLNIIGVSFHLGSICNNTLTYARGIEMASTVFQKAKVMGFRMTVLDIGGGFPGKNPNKFQQIGDVVNEALNEYFPSTENIKIIAEPGRYFVESAVTAACRIVSVKRTALNDSYSPILYYLNDGICGTFAFTCFAYEPFELKIVKDVKNQELCTSIVYGPTCWGDDIVKKKISLPKLQAGDWFYVENMGAYKHVLSNSFNGFEMSKMYAFCTKRQWSQLQNEFASSKFRIHNWGSRLIITDIREPGI